MVLPIKGRVVLTVGDQLRATAACGFRNFAYVAIFFVGLAVFLSWRRLESPSWNLVVDLLFIILVALAAMMLWAVAVTLFVHFRLSSENKTITYEIDEDRLVSGDAAGNFVTLSWGQVRYASEWKTGIVLRLKPMGSRWFVSRGFDDTEFQVFRDLLRKNLGKRSRLRG